MRPRPWIRRLALMAPVVLAGCLTTTELDVDGWRATCTGVAIEDCRGIAAVFVNNLARSHALVFDASGGRVVVELRPDCPRVPDWADPTVCWQATAPIDGGPVCMIVGRHPGAPGAVSIFGQVGGDELVGRLGGSPPGWPMCR